MIEPVEQFRDGLIESGQTEEHALPQSGQYPALHQKHTGFDFGFIPWFFHTCRNNGHAVMSGHVLIGGIQIRLIPAGMKDRGFTVIRNQ